MDSALFYFGKSLDNAQRLGNIELEAMAMGELGVVYNKLSQGEKLYITLEKSLTYVYKYLPYISFLKYITR